MSSILDINKTISKADKSAEIYTKINTMVTNIDNDVLVYLNSIFDISWSKYKCTDWDKGDFGTFRVRNFDSGVKDVGIPLIPTAPHDTCGTITRVLAEDIRQICIKYYPTCKLCDDSTNHDEIEYHENGYIRMLRHDVWDKSIRGIDGEIHKLHDSTISMMIAYNSWMYNMFSIHLYTDTSYECIIRINKAIFNK